MEFYIFDSGFRVFSLSLAFDLNFFQKELWNTRSDIDRPTRTPSILFFKKEKGSQIAAGIFSFFFLSNMIHKIESKEKK